jgi:U3 small nucleolar RNA-associated protein 5
MTKKEVLTEAFPVKVESDHFKESSQVVDSLALPKMNGLVEILVQGVTSNDAALLETAFSVTEPQLVRSTLQKLPADKVILVLDALVVRVTRKPVRALQLVPWMQILLQTQATALLAIPDFAERVKPLQAIIEGRTKNFKRMIQLRGKIDMLLNVTESEEQEINGMKVPLARYDESDDDDDDNGDDDVNKEDFTAMDDSESDEEDYEEESDEESE